MPEMSDPYKPDSAFAFCQRCHDAMCDGHEDDPDPERDLEAKLERAEYDADEKLSASFGCEPYEL